MRDTHITINADRPNQPLTPLIVGANCAASAIIEGAIPRDVVSLAVEIERTPDGQTPRPNFVVSATRFEHGCAFGVYFNPFCFTDITDALQYHINGTDEHGNPRYLGSGSLRVLKSTIGTSPVPPPVGAQGVFFASEVIDGVQHYKKQELRYDEDMEAWGAEWTGDYIYTTGGFVPYESGNGNGNDGEEA